MMGRVNQSRVWKTTQMSQWILKCPWTPCYLAGLALAGTSLVHLATTPLKALGVPYPSVLDYWHWLVAAACVLVWWLLPRRLVFSILAVVACATALGLGLGSAHSRVARILVTRFLTEPEKQSFGNVRVFEQSSSGVGHEVLVAPENEPVVREALQRIGVLRPSVP